MAVISKIEIPTEWCSHMVVVPKPNGDVKICVDPSKLNERILREMHPLPSGDYTLAKLALFSGFSKLDYQYSRSLIALQFRFLANPIVRKYSGMARSF